MGDRVNRKSDSSRCRYVVETDQLTKRYGDIVAVDHLDLRVRQGEVYGFLGANGAGKTTTLRMLLGLIQPTSGRASVLGATPGTEASLMEVGAMIETPAFYPHLSGRHNLLMLARYTGMLLDRIDQVLAQVDLSRRADDAFQTYSLGMKQRLGVAAALLKDPMLLFLDEPTNGLDPAGMADMRALIRKLGSGDRTVLISSHLMTEIEQICDRVGVIAGGTLVAEGTVDELRGKDTLLIRVDQIEVARRVVAGLVGQQAVAASNGVLHVTASNQDEIELAWLNARLVAQGIAVQELRWDRASLESVFLDLTSGQMRQGERGQSQIQANGHHEESREVSHV
jgi:ABC-type multidrug transport system ATPase subunit